MKIAEWKKIQKNPNWIEKEEAGKRIEFAILEAWLWIVSIGAMVLFKEVVFSGQRWLDLIQNPMVLLFFGGAMVSGRFIALVLGLEALRSKIEEEYKELKKIKIGCQDLTEKMKVSVKRVAQDYPEGLERVKKISETVEIEKIWQYWLLQKVLREYRKKELKNENGL